jgi:flagellar basal-body rod protein FlgB
MNPAFVILSNDKRGKKVAINFDNALGIHPQALALRERRSEILAANLANAETPFYKAQDLDFKSILNKEVSVNSSSLNRTHKGHMQGSHSGMPGVMYRNPQQASLDGNTVEAHIEQGKFAENSVQYQASLTFLNAKFSGLRSAIRGE